VVKALRWLSTAVSLPPPPGVLGIGPAATDNWVMKPRSVAIASLAAISQARDSSSIGRPAALSTTPG
jgi:hypothetical protein